MKIVKTNCLCVETLKSCLFHCKCVFS